jgi:hypothetical protein
MQTVCLISYNRILEYFSNKVEFLGTLCFPLTDLKVLGGVTPVVELLSHGLEEDSSSDKVHTNREDGSYPPQLSADIRAASAHVVGTAASNNVKFQQQILEAHPDIFRRLVRASKDPEEEVAVKGVYAMAAMVRNLPQMQDAFHDAGAIILLQSILKSCSRARGLTL